MISFENFVFSYLIISLFSLAWLTYEDYTNKYRFRLKSHVVDDRKNTYMFGLTTALFLISPFVWWVKLLLLFGNLVLMFLLSKYKVFGDADIRAFAWIFNGWCLIGFGLQFTLLWVFFVGLYVFFSRRVIFSSSSPFFLFIFLLQLLGFFLFLSW